jgi:hypothetical protein
VGPLPDDCGEFRPWRGGVADLRKCSRFFYGIFLEDIRRVCHGPEIGARPTIPAVVALSIEILYDYEKKPRAGRVCDAPDFRRAEESVQKLHIGIILTVKKISLFRFA